MSATVIAPPIAPPKGVFGRLWKIASDMPSTNARILCTLSIFYLTTLRYLLSGVEFNTAWFQLGLKAWEPSWEWCTLLGTMAGVDAVQFWAKRKTHNESAPPQRPDIEDMTGAQKAVEFAKPTQTVTVPVVPVVATGAARLEPDD